jgi:hypothetical protein
LSMLGRDTAPRGRAEPDRGPVTAATRAVATRQEVVHADTVGSTVITAEIPAVPVHRSYGVLLPDGSVWYPDSKRRLPAPWPLRFFVWVLALLLVLMLAGLAVVEWHPSWLAALRHTVGAAPTVQVGGGLPSTTAPAGGGTHTTTAGTSACVAAGGGETCTLTASTYTIDFTTTQRVNFEVKSVSTGAVIYANTQSAGQTQVIDVSGAATLVAYATGGTFTVKSGSTVLISATPARYSVVYTFQPAASATGP